MATARVPLTSPAHLSAGRRSLFMAGVLIALGAFVVTFLLGSFMVLRSQQILGGVSVVVAARDIQPREQLTAGSVELSSYPSNLVPSGALTGIDSAKGKFALSAIAKGEVLTTTRISTRPESTTSVSQGYLPIPKGFVAFTIPTGEQEGVAGYVAPGDYIDVIVTINMQKFGGSSEVTVTKTVFTNVHVIRVGPQSGAADAQGAAGGVSSSLTVIVSSCDAEMWSWFLANAAVRYELRAYQNYPAASPSPATGAEASPSPAGSTTSSSATSATSATSAASTQTATTTACDLGGTTGIGPSQVDSRFHFKKI
jgi:pilus assembly protein CpaB